MKATYRFDLARRAAALLALVALWGAAAITWGASYRILDLGTIDGGLSTVAYGINNSGQVVGVVDGGPVLYPFRTAPNQPINPATDDIGLELTGNTRDSAASDINASGQVVGWVHDAGIGFAFRTAPNQRVNPATDSLTPLGVASGINDSGQVVGFARAAYDEYTYYAFRTAPNQPLNPATDNLGTLGGDESWATGINASGQVVGRAQTASGQYHAFRTEPNQPINPATDDLGTVGVLWYFPWFEKFDINDSGQVVGAYVTTSGEEHAFRTEPNQPINPTTDDLGTLSGEMSWASSINNSGQVVGTDATFLSEGWERHAFVYSGNGPMRDLNELIDPASGWVLYSARDINDLGQIVGTGYHNGNVRAFLLTPIPEPATLVILWGYLLGLWLLRRRRYCAA